MSPRDEPGGRASRRRVLRAGGAALTAGLAAGTAGCQSGLPPLSGPITFGRLDAPAPGEARYAQWIPEASALISDTPDSEHTTEGGWQGGHVWYAQPRRLSGSAFGRGALPIGLTTAQFDYFGVGYANYDHAVAMLQGPVSVGFADVDRSTVAGTLDGTGYQSRESYRGYDVYSRSDVPRVVAVGDGVVVHAESGQDQPDAAMANARTVIRAGAGEVPRAVDTSGTFETLVERAGARPGNWLGVKPFGSFGDEDAAVTERLQTGSVGWDVDRSDDIVYSIQDFVYERGTAAPEREIKRALASNRRAVESSLVDVETDGRFARVEMRRRTDAFDANPGPPQVTWGVEHDRDARTVTFTNEAGDAADPARLSIDGDPGNAAWDTAFDQFDRFAPGDSVTVDVSDVASGGTVRVVYTSPDGDSTSTLFSYSLPGVEGSG